MFDPFQVRSPNMAKRIFKISFCSIVITIAGVASCCRCRSELVAIGRISAMTFPLYQTEYVRNSDGQSVLAGLTAEETAVASKTNRKVETAQQDCSKRTGFAARMERY